MGVEEDNWEWHTFDTVKGGDYLVDQDAAEVMAKEAIEAVLDLEKMGLPFNRTPDGKIDKRRFGGHTRNHGEAAVRKLARSDRSDEHASRDHHLQQPERVRADLEAIDSQHHDQQWNRRDHHVQHGGEAGQAAQCPITEDVGQRRAGRVS